MTEDGRCEAEIKARMHGDGKRGIQQKKRAANSENGQKVEKANYIISCMEYGLTWK